MSERVTLASAPDGALVAHKHAPEPGDEPRLRHEARLLRAAAHPAVVRLLHEEDRRLTLGWVGGHSLATTPQHSFPGAVALTISAATTLADLHQIGISHGAIDASHLLLDPSGRPVLCSFSAATQASSPIDPDHGRRADADVAALGEVLQQLLREVAPAPPGRWRRRHQARAVARLADRAVDDPPSRRLSARALAAALSDAVPEARLAAVPTRADGEAALRTVPTTPPRGDHELAAPAGPPAAGVAQPVDHALAYLDHLRPAEPIEPTRRARRPARVLAAATGAGLVLLALVVLLAPGADDPQRRPTGGAATVPPTRLPTTTTAPRATAPGRATETPPTPGAAGAEAPGSDCPDGADAPLDAAAGHVDVDGDGCPESVIVEGNTVRVGTRRWQLGRADDLISVADWDCDGVATPALLRPGSGEVFVFTRWAPPSGRVDVPATTVVPSATALAPDRATCPALVVQRGDGTHVTLPRPEPLPEATP